VLEIGRIAIDQCSPVLVALPTPIAEDLESISMNHFERWKLGRSPRANNLLVEVYSEIPLSWFFVTKNRACSEKRLDIEIMLRHAVDNILVDSDRTFSSWICPVHDSCHILALSLSSGPRFSQ
jgi:hypothetical protein